MECRICGQSIYFPVAEEAMTDGERLIELTCSRGHTDSYWDVEVENPPANVPVVETLRALAVGF